MKEMPLSERPREKLLSAGPEALSNQELLALLIGSGVKGESAMALAAGLLGSSDEGIVWIGTASPEEIAAIRGIGAATACRITAAAELGRRMAAGRQDGRLRPVGPEDAARLFMEEMRYSRNEVFKVLLLNVRGEMMGRETVSEGSINASIVDAREVFRPAIRRGAAGIVLVHNHPSGDPSPSRDDIDTTKGLVRAGELLGVNVLDHIVIGDGRFVSFRQEGLI
jgi:DNA repair protein RadC